jgi:hypothetical protein
MGPVVVTGRYHFEIEGRTFSPAQLQAATNLRCCTRCLGRFAGVTRALCDLGLAEFSVADAATLIGATLLAREFTSS